MHSLRLGIALALGALAVTAAPAPPMDGGELRIVEPRYNATVIGTANIAAEVVPPAGARIRDVVFLVDGTRVATLTSPPWWAVWDAGDGSRGRRIEVIATFSDGSKASASVRTSQLRINYREDVTLVNVYAVVRDGSGGYVTDLTRDEFRVAENGEPQSIERFTADRRPLRIGIVIDTSLTMEGDKIGAAREAALRFLDVLEPGDEGLVVTFSDGVDVAQGLTSDRAALAHAIASVEVRGGTALYDAVWETAEHLEQFDGRRVMVLLSDGRDEAASGLEPGSFHTIEEALDRALRNEVMIWSIGVGRSLDRLLDFYGRRSLASILEEISETTGGRLLLSPRPRRLRAAFEDIADDLRHQYLISYSPSDPRRDGTWRRIELSTTRPELEVNGRKGYFAEPTEEEGVAGRSSAAGTPSSP